MVRKSNREWAIFSSSRRCCATLRDSSRSTASTWTTVFSISAFALSGAASVDASAAPAATEARSATHSAAALLLVFEVVEILVLIVILRLGSSIAKQIGAVLHIGAPHRGVEIERRRALGADVLQRERAGIDHPRTRYGIAHVPRREVELRRQQRIAGEAGGIAW